MDSSVDAVHHKKVSKAVEKADFIII
jgi:hypothetical protein